MKWFGYSRQSVASEDHHKVSKRDKNRHMNCGYTTTSTFLYLILTILFCAKTCNGIDEIIGQGTFNANFILYRDSSYLSPYYENENPAFHFNQMLYMEIQLQLETPSSAGLVILAEECAGVPVEGGDQKFDLIIDGCKAPDDPYQGEILTNGAEYRVRFTHIVFMFRESAATIIQCKIRLCIDKCEPTCPAAEGRKRRDVANNNSTLTTAGITINVIQPTEDDSPSIDIQLLWLGGFIILSLILLVAIAIFVYNFLTKQRHFRLHNDVTKKVPVHEITICKGDF